MSRNSILTSERQSYYSPGLDGSTVSQMPSCPRGTMGQTQVLFWNSLSRGPWCHVLIFPSTKRLRPGQPPAGLNAYIHIYLQPLAIPHATQYCHPSPLSGHIPFVFFSLVSSSNLSINSSRSRTLQPIIQTHLSTSLAPVQMQSHHLHYIHMYLTLTYIRT